MAGFSLLLVFLKDLEDETVEENACFWQRNGSQFFLQNNKLPENEGEVTRPSVWYTTTDGNPVSYIKLFPKDLVRLMSWVPRLDFDSVC